MLRRKSPLVPARLAVLCSAESDRDGEKERKIGREKARRIEREKRKREKEKGREIWSGRERREASKKFGYPFCLRHLLDA